MGARRGSRCHAARFHPSSGDCFAGLTRCASARELLSVALGPSRRKARTEDGSSQVVLSFGRVEHVYRRGSWIANKIGLFRGNRAVWPPRRCDPPPISSFCAKEEVGYNELFAECEDEGFHGADYECEQEAALFLHGDERDVRGGDGLCSGSCSSYRLPASPIVNASSASFSNTRGETEVHRRASATCLPGFVRAGESSVVDENTENKTGEMKRKNFNDAMAKLLAVMRRCKLAPFC